MKVPKSPAGSPAWPRYHTYARLVVCLLLLPLVVTGLVLVPEARMDFVATTLIVACCLYIDTDAVTRHARPKAGGSAR